MIIDKLDEIVNKYNDAYHRTIKVKPFNVKSNTYIDFSKDSKYKIGSIVRISKYTNISAKGYTPNWSEEVFVIKKSLKYCAVDNVINDLDGEKNVGTFYKNELPKTNQKESRIEKVIRRKGDKLYVKWKGYNNSFNSWADKKDSINE